MWASDTHKDAATPKERFENIAYDLLSSYRDGTRIPNRLFYDTEMAARLQEKIDNPVVESVNPETGVNEVTLVDAWEVKTFEKVDVETFRAMPGMKAVSRAFRAPDASTPGRYKGVEYQPGDSILTIPDTLHRMNDSIVVLDKDLNPRWDQVSVGGSQIPPAIRSAAGQSESFAPPKNPQMLAWEKKNGVSFVWVDYEGRYVATLLSGGASGIERYEALPDGTIRQLSISE